MTSTDEDTAPSLEAQRLMAALEQKMGLADELRPPKIGRFTVLDHLGAGGMGVVYAVYDAELDRRVALKLIRGGRAPQLRERLRREAQALAKLSHPNVVPVFEVGEHEGEAFLAMEFVEGRTLRQWAKDEERDAHEIVEKYVQAGRGLQAAHGSGLVHRDFKPDNAIVGSSGRVRVLDFGLARQTSEGGGVPVDTTSDLDAPGRSGALDTPLTQTGTLLGTPHYMAPEQFDGSETDHRSDQFSFCVSLWEALSGERPFQGESLAELMEAVTNGTLPLDTKLPSRLRPVLKRGLAIDPDRRWPSMEALLEQLDTRPAATGRAVWFAVPVAALGIGAIALAAGERDEEPCTGAVQLLAEVWDGGTRAEAAFRGTELPYADDTWARTSAALDVYASAWTDMHRDACLATAVRKEQSTDVLDLRMGCLHRARVEMGAVVRVFEDADDKVVDRASELVDSLPALARCADAVRLQSEEEPPSPEDAPAVDALRVSLANAHAARIAGRYDEAESELQSAREALAQVEYEPADVELALVEGALHKNQQRYDASEHAYRRALEVATRRMQRAAMRDAAIELMTLVGAEQKRGEEAMQSYGMLAEQLSVGDPRSQSRFASGYGFLLFSERKYAEAEAQIRRALALMTEYRGPEHLDVAHLHEALSQMLLYQGRLEESEAAERQALAIFEPLLGADHPRLASSRLTLGNALFFQGKLDEAQEAFQRALASQQKTLGATHVALAGGHTGLGMVLDSKDDLEGAEHHFRRALELKAAGLGPDHPETARSRANLGEVLSNRGKYEEAEKQARLTLVSYDREPGPDHPETAAERMALGRLLTKQERYEEAVAEHRMALKVFEAKLEPDHPDATLCRTELALALVGLGRHEEALALAERAWEQRQGEHVAPFDRAETAYVLARAVAARGDDARARELAAEALPVYEELGLERNAAVVAWLRARAGDHAPSRK